MTVANEPTAGDIFRLIPEIMRRVGGIAKSRKNQQQGYTFRGIDDIYNACQPVMAELGVFIVPAVLKRENFERETAKGGVLFYTRLEVQHTFYAADGSNVVAVTIGEAMDSGDKSANKAMSAAMKYAMIETFSIPTEEFNDTENQTHEPLPQRQQQAPPAPRPQPAQQTQRAEVKLASEMQVREVKTLLPLAKLPTALIDEWFKRAGVGLWEKMPADTIGKCITYLREKIEQQRQKEPEPTAANPAPPPTTPTTDDEWEAFSNALVENAERAGEVDRVTAVLTVLKKRNLNADQLSEVLTAMEKSEFDWQTSQITTAQQAA